MDLLSDSIIIIVIARLYAIVWWLIQTNKRGMH
jgi:hypothetical protein